MMGWRGQHGERPKDGACDKSLKQPEPSMSGGMRVDQQYPVGEERCRGSPKISLEHVIITFLQKKLQTQVRRLRGMR